MGGVNITSDNVSIDPSEHVCEQASKCMWVGE